MRKHILLLEDEQAIADTLIYALDSEGFSVSLDDPVDVYRQTERATKYATMFIVLTFAAFFVLEMMRRWRIHPMQYLMSGLLVALYGVLYGILISEDNALMMGSLLLFGVLAAAMTATRRVDWYNVMGSAPAASDPLDSHQRAA